MSAAQGCAGDELTVAGLARGCTGMVGRSYLGRGHPVVVLARVLIERADGSQVVRPFRGLRRAGGSR